MTAMLADRVSVLRRFRRSVRVGADTGAAEIEGFVCTATAARALETTVDHAATLGHTAFTWTGPYGCGKSTLAVVLAAALGKPGKAREQAMAGLPEGLRNRLPQAMRWSRPGWRVIPVVGRRTDAATVIAEALPEPPARPDETVRALVALAASEPCGVLLIIDEMGKLLEHAATEGGDAYFFQELAEAAARSEGRSSACFIRHSTISRIVSRARLATIGSRSKAGSLMFPFPRQPRSRLSCYPARL